MGSIQPDLVTAYAPEPAHRPVEATARQLSEREREVLAHFAQGRSTKSVAQILAISPRTVETYAATIAQKLRARNRIHAVAIAFSRGILTHPDRPAAPTVRQPTR
ncbi:MAG TPA: helix-turn-helix transcriptional regulator [Xanthobacteraceae bacterium]|nr:helix-turn-helix transcriptional regulator [Xanthobacteraceae bacterium]